MIVCVRVARLDSPEVGEPLDELSGVVFVELDVREEELDDGTAWVADVEEHELGFAQVHRCQRARLQNNRNDISSQLHQYRKAVISKMFILFIAFLNWRE